MSAPMTPVRAAGDGIDLLTALARAVVALYRAEAVTLSLPYPADVQRCFDQVTWECLKAGEPPPGSVPDLMTWCRERPLGSWPIALGAGLVSASAMLVDPVSSTPTATCAELASYGPSGVLEQDAWSAFDDCLTSCPQSLRSTCRDLLLRYIVVDRSAHFAMHPQTARAWDYVADLYGPAPRDLMAEKKIVTCNECGMLAMPDLKSGPWCESEACRRSAGFEWHEPDRIRVLLYPLRAFVAKAGRTELAVRDKLHEYGFHVLPHPSGRDMLRVQGPSGAWSMQVHTRAEPVLHAATVAAATVDEAGHRLIVMAAGTLSARPDYTKTFRKALPAGSGVTLVADRALIRWLNSQTRRRERGHDA